MKHSGLADSPLFPPQKERPVSQKPSPAQRHEPNQATMPPTKLDTMVSRYHDTTVQTIRKSIRSLGKEAATHRFTLEEKQAIADLVYEYNKAGIRTCENEITRIAIHFLLQDHHANKQDSLLQRVLQSLNE